MKMNMNRLLVSVLMALTMLVHLPSVLAQENDWPRTLPLNKGMMTIYSLQVDDMSDDIVHFRAALAYRETPGAEPVFGAGWFESRVEIDTDGRIVHPTDLKVTETRFPAGTDDLQSDLSSVLAQQSSAWNLDFSLDQLEASLKTAEAESIAAEGMNTSPPRIIYRDQPALLISLDGEPILRDIESSPYQAVINTPYPLIFDGSHYYLNAAKNVWYRANKATGPYQFESRPPEDIAAMVNASDTEMADEQDFESVTAVNAPEIVVSTEPAELIVTEGPAAFVPLVDDLLVLQNSEDDVFMHVSSQNFYIVLAGRWYQASSLNGPWSYQPSDELPVAFANIPQESSQADSRVYVAGTPEARDAVLDAQVPQTAAVARGEVDIEVKYDGQPVYQPVDGTGMVYIKNTGSTVIQSEGLYYLVEKGVWYVSPSPNGPWQVSDHRPVQVETILPTSPVYNVKYVHVYHSTPNVVYVGYTPGYTGSYVYHNTVFYGSGWYHQPWVSPYYYYPRRSTWGFHASYNPWSGWNYGLSWGWGLFSMSYYSGGYWHHGQRWHHGHYGGWGPRGYRPRPVHHRSGHKRYAHQANRRGNHGQRDYRDNRRSDNRSNSNERNDNLYRDDTQRARLVDTRDRSSRASGSSNPGRSNPGRSNSDTRQANNTGDGNNRQPNHTKIKNGERNRIGPVHASDLSLKAKVRDANFEASRNRLLADNNGNVYRGLGRNRDLNQTVGNKNGLARSTGNRATSRSRDGQQDINRGSGRNRNRSSSPGTGNNGSERTTQQTQLASLQRSPTRYSETSDRSRSSRSANTRVRESTPEPSKKNARQGSSREYSAQAKVRESSRTDSQQKSSGVSSRNQSTSSQSTPRETAQKSGNRRNDSKSGGKRESGRRSRD
jgi:hypothetical protein